MGLGDLTNANVATASAFDDNNSHEKILYVGKDTKVTFVFLETNVLGHDFLKDHSIFLPNNEEMRGYHMQKVLTNRPLRETPADLVGKPNKNNPKLKLNKYYWDRNATCVLSDAHESMRTAGQGAINLARKSINWLTPVFVISIETIKDGKREVVKVNDERLINFSVGDSFFEMAKGIGSNLETIITTKHPKTGIANIESKAFVVQGRDMLSTLENFEDYLDDEGISIISQKRAEYSKRKSELIEKGEFNSIVALNPSHQKLYPMTYEEWMDMSDGHLYHPDDFEKVTIKPAAKLASNSKKTDLTSKPTEEEIMEVGQLS